MGTRKEKEHGREYIIKRSYYFFKKIKEEWFNLNNKRSREKKPAYIEYYSNGLLKCEKYFRNGKPVGFDNSHPTEIFYNKDGNIIKKVFYSKSLEFKQSIEYYQNKQIKKVVYYLFLNNKYIKHKDGDKPSEISFYIDGKKESEKWFFEGSLKRKDPLLPIIIKYDKDENIDFNRYSDDALNFCRNKGWNIETLTPYRKAILTKYLHSPSI